MLLKVKVLQHHLMLLIKNQIYHAAKTRHFRVVKSLFLNKRWHLKWCKNFIEAWNYTPTSVLCHETWTLKTNPKQPDKYICSRCSREKSIPKLKFSIESSMIPSSVLKEFQGLTWFVEMFVARTFPVVHVYTKPRGGQKAYKGHVITLPQDVQQLADIHVPRCP